MRDYSHGSYLDIMLRSQDLQSCHTVRVRVDKNDSYTRFPAKLLTEMGWSIKGWVRANLEERATPPRRIPGRYGIGGSHNRD